ncbi:putative vesicle-mediated transport protein Bfr2/Che-1 [Cladophialophora carrionii]|uniref:Protein BFR2 n=1 Tax=Cladophialophora carrionii TaxID=86049 RepID=A0A1C1CIA0_9EURO|nr:putative vesicle-mediated transport protein Bfr2/Che-1 [Cladophialophora carrionii]
MGSLKTHPAQMDRNKVKDFDPEDDVYLRPADSDASESEEGEQNNAGREHYEAVDQSRLRKPAQPILGTKYDGVAVTRKALEDDDGEDPFAPVDEDDEEDPFATKAGHVSGSEVESEEADDQDLKSEAEEDEEIDSDEALGESDVERFKHLKFRGSKRNQTEAAGSDEDGLSGADTDTDPADGLSDESDNKSTDPSDIDMEDEEDEDDASSASSATPPPPGRSKSARSGDREELRRAAESASTAGLASALSAGASADVKKGQAVKQQRQAFERLLDARIKLQKGVAAMNELPSDTISDEEARAAARKAEDAALALWSTIDSIRSSILSSQIGTSPDSNKPERKRKLIPTRSTPLTQIWERTTSLETQAQSQRRTVLDKWHAKTQPILDTTQQRSKLLRPSQAGNSRLTDVLDTYLLSESPKITSHSYSASTQTFDDTTFYQSLLRDLIASRSAANSSGVLTTQLAGPQKLHPSGSKTKKIDTKASKGRKIRYTVHEKLENFMAPEDRNTWTEAARAEFFGSLLGNVNALAEKEIGGMGEMDEEITEGEALRLFRS